jgi:hypothetical protein
MSAAAQAQFERQFGDWRWRMNSLYWIVDEDANSVLFKMRGPQETLFDEMWYLNLILKARQLGFTTFIQLFILDACLFNRNVHAGIIAHTKDDAETFFQDKIKYAYEHLPESIRAWNPTRQDSARELLFANGSVIRVGTSLRSGTYQYLHISEYGKLCAQWPEKAEEVRTGALNTLHAGNVAFIESTAEGMAGHFFELCQQAQENKRQGLQLTELDFKFFFFPWHKHPPYAIESAGVAITADDRKYFDSLSDEHGIELSDGQKAWYVKKAAQQGDKMKREHPSTPIEAFQAKMEGAYYGALMAKADINGRIGRVKYDPKLPVDSWWDLGMDDSTTLWLHQRVGNEHRFVGYYENSGEALPHYTKWLTEWAAERQDVQWGEHVMPHDAEVRSLNDGQTRAEVMRGKGFPVRVMERSDLQDGIEAVRTLLPLCHFDKEDCALGITRLRSYSKERNEKLDTWRDNPRKDDACHGADAFRTGAMRKVQLAKRRSRTNRKLSIV